LKQKINIELYTGGINYVAACGLSKVAISPAPISE